MAENSSEIRYLTPIKIEVKKEKTVWKNWY